jgi:hypothetical protein
VAGATVECICCGTPSERERIVEQAQAGQMGQHLLAVVELLPKDNPERKALLSLLGTRLDLESRYERPRPPHRRWHRPAKHRGRRRRAREHPEGR